MRKVNLLLVAFAALVTTGCPPANSTRITIYVRTCVVQGAKWYQAPPMTTPATSRTNAVTKIVQDASAIWVQGADIAFIPLLDRNGEIPEIVVPGAGSHGEIVQDQGDNFSDQSASAIDLCNQAWQNQTPDGSVPGIPIIFAGNFLADSGQISGQTGYETPNQSNYQRNGGKDLCHAPYNILQSDVTDRVAFVSTSNNDSSSDTQFAAELATRTAHELGHALLLAHGDGLDDDQNGAWDERCDNPEYLSFDSAESATSVSIMNAAPTNQTTITPLQRTLARSAAKYVAGVIGGPFP
jgi:hypothetical protein